MKPPRLNIARVMVIVAIVAIDLGAFRELHDGLEGALLSDTLPMVNIKVFVGILRFRGARAFTVGFAVVGLLSILAYQVWSRNNPWTVLRSFRPFCDPIAD